jgi:hypothetical protein
VRCLRAHLAASAPSRLVPAMTGRDYAAEVHQVWEGTFSGSAVRQRPGQWCRCGDPPEGQPPHDCASDHPRRAQCHADGAHVHPFPPQARRG